MRPIRLEMCAFGPFAGSEVLEFAELGQNPLFLINGPTGAGKTSILDAICYALYGETTSNERDAAQMRCHNAVPELLTEVTFLFELGGTRYRIRRVPEQERPKKSGEGKTRQPSESQLYRIAEDGSEQVLVARKVTDATQMMIDLTGLSAEQFRQVMVLPQGKFRELLLAPSEAREKIFQQLFQTQVYSRLENLLRERANALSSEVARLRERQGGMLLNTGAENAAALASAVAQLAQELVVAETARKAAEQQHTVAQQALERARQQEKAFAQCEAAQVALAQLETQEHLQADNRRRIEGARAARAIAPLFDALQEREGEYAQVLQRQQSAEAALQLARQAESDASSAASAVQAQRPLFESNSKTLDQLNAMVSLVGELAEASTQLQTKRAALAAAKQRANELQGALDHCIGQIAASETRIAEQRTQIDTLANAPAEHARLRELLAKRQRLDTLRAELEQGTEKQKTLGKEQLAAEAALTQASSTTRALANAWTAAQAAVLASQLQPGLPCAVCGSTEHPQPAHQGGAVPDATELEQASTAEDSARAERDTLREQSSSLAATRVASQQQIAALEGELGEHADESAAALAQRGEVLSKDAARLAMLRAELPEAQADLEKLRQQRGVHEAELRSAADSVDAAAREEASAATMVSERQQRVPEDMQQPAALGRAIAALETELAQLGALLSASASALEQAREARIAAESSATATREGAEKAGAQHKAAGQRWQQALASSSYSSNEEFRAALITPQEQAGLEQQLREYQDTLLLARRALEEKQAAIAGLVRPELTQTAEFERDKRATLTQAIDQLGMLGERHKTQSAVLKTLETLAREQAAREAEYAVTGKLSQVANGSNAYRLSLQRFVLAALLDDVLIEADHRLKLMSKGRYRLLRRLEADDMRGKSGLDLDVEDAYTGTRRSVATLSGGESFMAALSLALGLSDVVQAHSGGIRLDTLFIDEGFGSLDPDSLDLAIRTLVDLQAAGRMVGIISHVPELKQQISAQVVVEAGVSGSRLRVVGE
ncbi:MAG: SMC family ATPase [Pseudomonadales bacterium]|nr:SMC family ATPase [Pseudomonadales bacterium]